MKEQNKLENLRKIKEKENQANQVGMGSFLSVQDRRRMPMPIVTTQESELSFLSTNYVRASGLSERKDTQNMKNSVTSRKPKPVVDFLSSSFFDTFKKMQNIENQLSRAGQTAMQRQDSNSDEHRAKLHKARLNSLTLIPFT